MRACVWPGCRRDERDAQAHELCLQLICCLIDRCCKGLPLRCKHSGRRNDDILQLLADPLGLRHIDVLNDVAGLCVDREAPTRAIDGQAPIERDCLVTGDVFAEFSQPRGKSDPSRHRPPPSPCPEQTRFEDRLAPCRP
jgi:hypothetical protein